MTESIRTAIVGLGGFGLQHVEAFSRDPRCELVAVVDINGSKAEDTASRFGVPAWFTSTAEMLTHTVPDAVSVVTAGSHHLEPTLEALAAGSSVLLEKPLVLTTADGELLRAAAENSRGFVMPAHVLRFGAPYTELKRRVDSGMLGQILTMSFRRHRSRDHDARFTDVHPAFMTAIHDIDLALWFSGSGARDISAVEVKLAGRVQPVSVWARVRATDDALWSFQVSWLLPNASSVGDSLEIFGSNGMVSLGQDLTLRQFVEGSPDEELDFAGYSPESGVPAEVEHFLDCVQRGLESPIVTLSHALQGISIAERITEDCRADAADREPE